MSETNKLDSTISTRISRRRFFGYTGILAGAGLLAGVSSCRREEDAVPYLGINLGSGDTGMLNYSYVLEQIAAAFYIQATAGFYSGITAREMAYLNDIRDHEIAHRELFKAALSSNAVPSLTFNFSSVNFADRTSVLSTARSLEDLGVSAYNGAGVYFTNPSNLTLTGKIASVEARHAAIIRELLLQNSFADTTIVNVVSRIDLARTPQDVLAMVSQYITETLNAANLPTV